MFKEKVSKISFVNIQDFKFCELLNLSIDVKFKIKKVLVAQLVKRLPTMWETQVQSLVWEDSPGEGNGNPLQHSCLGNRMDRGAWQATVHGVAKESDTTKWLKTRKAFVEQEFILV